jgi:protein-disulfide isomerase
MRTFGWIVLAVVVGCGGPQRPQPVAAPAAAPSSELEARVLKLEAELARREASLTFLQRVYEAQQAETQEREEREPDPDAIFAVDIAANLRAGLVEGPVSAPVTIVKAFDFACPYCSKLNDALEALVKDYKGQVRVVYKNLVVHPDTAMPAHLASCAAAKQHKYLAFKHEFWAKGFAPYAESGGKDRASIGVDNITKIARGLGLDLKRFKADMDGGECKAFVESDMQELEKFKVSATPTIFINGTVISGALPKDALAQLIDQKLALVAKAGVAGAEYYDKEIMAKGEHGFRARGKK